MMAKRARRFTKKKKKDPTAMILMFAGVGFAFILLFVVLLNSQSTTKQSKSAARNEHRTIATEVESYKRDQNNAAAKTKRKQFRKQPSQRSESEKQTKPREKRENRGNSINSIEIPSKQKSFSPSDINTLPTVFTLPDKPVDEQILTDTVRFTDDAQCEINLHSAAQRGAEIKRTNDHRHSWTFTTNNNEPLADIYLSEEGIIFNWDSNTNSKTRTLLHNSKITLSSGRHRKTIQLRPIVKAPHIQLFGRDAEQKYTFDLKHAPSEIHWSLEPADPNQDPFSFPSVGAPTTDGLIPITKSLEWTPENNTGVVKAKYVWKCTTEPGNKLHELCIQITQTKEYKLGDAKWRPLTTESLRRDWDDRLEKYDNVVAGIQRKILKGKYPSGKQISTLRRMVREGIAFADVRVFYYALPDRTMSVDFRTPCGPHDTLLAQYPASQMTGFGMTGGDLSKSASQGFGQPTYGKPMGQSSKPSSPNSGASSLPAKNDDSRTASPDENSNASKNDELWTMPPGQNPWKARQQQLEKMSPGKK